MGPVWTPESDPHLGAVGPAQFWGDPGLRQRAADPRQHTGLGADHWAGNKARCHQIEESLRICSGDQVTPGTGSITLAIGYRNG